MKIKFNNIVNFNIFNNKKSNLLNNFALFNFSKSNFKMIRKPTQNLFPLHEHEILKCSNQFRKGNL